LSPKTNGGRVHEMAGGGARRVRDKKHPRTGGQAIPPNGSGRKKEVQAGKGFATRGRKLWQWANRMVGETCTQKNHSKKEGTRGTPRTHVKF